MKSSVPNSLAYFSLASLLLQEDTVTVAWMLVGAKMQRTFFAKPFDFENLEKVAHDPAYASEMTAGPGGTARGIFYGTTYGYLAANKDTTQANKARLRKIGGLLLFPLVTVIAFSTGRSDIEFMKSVTSFGTGALLSYLSQALSAKYFPPTMQDLAEDVYGEVARAQYTLTR